MQYLVAFVRIVSRDCEDCQATCASSVGRGPGHFPYLELARLAVDFRTILHEDRQWPSSANRGNGGLRKTGLLLSVSTKETGAPPRNFRSQPLNHDRQLAHCL
jgi:hypothetical protein